MFIRILKKIFAKLESIERTLGELIQIGKNTMATVADLEQEIQSLTTAVSDAATRVSAKLADLQAQIAAGATAADLSPQIAEIATDVTALGNIGA